MRKTVVKIGWIVLRLAVTVGMLGFLLTLIDLKQLSESLSHAQPWFLAVSVSALAVLNVFVAWRWRLILGSIEHPVRYRDLLRLMFVGLFFNQLLPTGVGGDAMRAWGCHRLGLKLGASIRSVLLDRVFGCAVLLILNAATLPVLFEAVVDPLQRQGFLALLLGGLAALGLLFCVDFLPSPLLRFRFLAQLSQIAREGRHVLANPGRAATIALLSASGLFLTVLAADFTGMAVGIRLPFLQWLAVLLPTMLIQLVPVSIGGWGVREMVLVMLLGSFGVEKSDAFAASLLIGFSQIFVSLPGALIWMQGSLRSVEGRTPANGAG